MAKDEEPIVIDPAVAADDLKRIVALNREILEAKVKENDAHEAYKAAKRHRESLQDEQFDLIQDVSTPRPLLAAAGARPPAPEPPPAPAADPGGGDDAWRAEPITVLTLHGLTEKQVQKLIEGDVTTLGALADLGDGLTAIKGIGPSLAEKIADAATSYHTTRRATPDADEEGGPAESIAPMEPAPDGAPRPFVVRFLRRKAKRHVVYARDEAEALHWASDQMTFVDGVTPIGERDVEDSDVVARVPEGYDVGPQEEAPGELIVEPDPDADAGPDEGAFDEDPGGGPYEDEDRDQPGDPDHDPED